MVELSSPKILPFSEARSRCDDLRERGRRIVQSHGIFDLIHPGHIAHLEEARALGDVLVVTVTADKHVHKGPGRPYFNEQLRLMSLAALECVDFVVLVPFSGATEAIETVRPNVYCKGKEYEDPDYDDTGGLQEEMEAVQRVSGEMRFVGPIKLSSTKLLNLYFDHQSVRAREFCVALSNRYTRKGFREAVESLGKLRILVLGETIFDRYSSVRVQGLTSKSRILSGRFLRQETHCGGALAVLRHVRQFTSQVKFLSVVGSEPWVDSLLREHVEPAEDLVIRDSASTTIVKERFIEPPGNGGRLSQLFAVNYLDADPPSEAVQAAIEERLLKVVREVDAVFLLDFGHGLLTPALRERLQEVSPFLVLNCQTNSNNHGFNIISRQYQRADAFTLDEQEIMLAAGRRHPDFERELESLKTRFGSRYAWLTRGPVQTLGLANDQQPCSCPPLETDVIDSVGAGDAFFAAAGLAAVQGLPVDLATFMGQLAGAQAVRVVGNAHSISKQILIKSGMSLLDR